MKDITATTDVTAGEVTARRQTAEVELHSDSDSKSIWSLVFYTLSVIVVCLSAFNFYLFCWIWSSLSAAAGSGRNGGSVSVLRSSQWAPIGATSSWHSIKFNGRLASLQELEVGQIMANPAEDGGRLAISSKNSLQLSHQKRPLIELVAKRARIQLARGLQVAGGGAARNVRDLKFLAGDKPEMKLNCDHNTAHCLVDAPIVELSHRRGVDFGRKSVQAPQVATRRLHSPTNWLNLLSTKTGRFETETGSIHVTALDELSLFSHNSAVILDSETIDASRIRGFNGVGSARGESRSLNGSASMDEALDSGRRKSLDGKYRLCVCLPVAAAEHAPNTMDRDASARNVASADGKGLNPEDRLGARRRRRSRQGLVFAIKPQLNCSRFSASFCNKSLQ